MRIGEIYKTNSFGLSIEIFPPKTDAADANLLQTLERLKPFQPAFVSCTYGAGGTTRAKTLDWCDRIQTEFQLPATAHFTCVGSTTEDLTEWLQMAKQRGIQNIMALRGDPPQGADSFEAVEGGLRYANELVALIRDQFSEMNIGVAAYPEKHPEAPDAETDLANLKRKVEAGADAIYTQLFYENSSFFEFRERCLAAGIDRPIIPGIMPITEFARIKRITSMCGATIPNDLAQQLEAAQEDKQAQFEIGVNYAIQQCRDLIEQGVPGIHFYVLNRSGACEKILNALGLHP